ncbi:uncharacterized protein [Leptinotarsa decemlineata]|uniref:uncharacterized protein n=1 Tax=Leptinotarsa decemlineata TaxID=7539 RepID=UPI003D30659D
MHVRRAFSEVASKYANYSHIYTDASKTSESVGAAVITDHTSYSYRLPTEASIYVGEIFAIAKALAHYRKHGEDSVFFTDSPSAIQGIQQLYPRNSLLMCIKPELGKLAEMGKRIKIIWVPSHVGIVGNETADTLAREISSNPSSISTRYVPHEYLIHKIRQLTINTWRERWQALETTSSKQSILA